MLVVIERFPESNTMRFHPRHILIHSGHVSVQGFYSPKENSWERERVEAIQDPQIKGLLIDLTKVDGIKRVEMQPYEVQLTLSPAYSLEEVEGQVYQLWQQHFEEIEFHLKSSPGDKQGLEADIGFPKG